MTVDVETRAILSGGTSEVAIYRAVSDVLMERHCGGGVLVDVGCGKGNLWAFVADRFDRYLGADVVYYDGFPANGEFQQVDLDSGQIPLPDSIADIVSAVETIEHVENPRAFVRELCRLTRPGGWIVISTPNQLSFLSKLTLIVKNQFNAFTDNSYPAHLTALLESDLRRIASECRLIETGIAYTCSGRIPGTPWHYPHAFSRMQPRWFSDNVILASRKPLIEHDPM